MKNRFEVNSNVLDELTVNEEIVKIPNTVKAINKDLKIKNKEKIKEIHIPNTVKFISRCFNQCENLEKIIFEKENMDNNLIIDKNTFIDCPKLNYINFPKNLQKIGYCSFSGSNLTNITLPSSLKEIGIWVFNPHIKTDIFFEGTQKELESIDGYEFLTRFYNIKTKDDITIDDLINEGKSIKEINNLFKGQKDNERYI